MEKNIYMYCSKHFAILYWICKYQKNGKLSEISNVKLI